MQIRDEALQDLCTAATRGQHLRFDPEVKIKFLTSILKTLLVFDPILDTCLLNLRSDDTNTPRFLSHSDTSRLIIS